MKKMYIIILLNFISKVLYTCEFILKGQKPKIELWFSKYSNKKVALDDNFIV